MNMWMLTAIVLGILVIGGIAVTALNTEPELESKQDSIECSSCGNSCSLESNCGLSACGAVNGGSCGCGR